MSCYVNAEKCKKNTENDKKKIKLPYVAILQLEIPLYGI